MVRPIDVAHVVLSLDPGGLERIVVDLVREARSLGQQAAVICLEHRGALAEFVESLGARVFCVEKRAGVRPGTALRIGRLLAQVRPDVIHTHQIGALLYAGPAARVRGVPVVHTEHGKHLVRARARLVGRLAALNAKRFFCVSADIAAAVIRHGVAPRRRVIVVRNGVDLERFAAAPRRDETRASLGIRANAQVVGTVGRLAEIKRQDRLVRAFAELAPQFPHARLLLVGDGPLRGELAALADSLGVGDRTHFTGYQPAPERFLAAMDVFALTSRSEGMPMAILEAWAAGLPVVASSVGGIPELVEHGRTGLLYDEDDAPGLVASLRGLLDDDSLRRRLGGAGHEVVRARYSLRRMAETYDGHYRELAGRSPGAAHESFPALQDLAC